MVKCPICDADLKTRKVGYGEAFYCENGHVFKYAGKCHAKLPVTGFTCGAKLFESIAQQTKGNQYCTHERPNRHIFVADLPRDYSSFPPVHVRAPKSRLDYLDTVQIPAEKPFLNAIDSNRYCPVCFKKLEPADAYGINYYCRTPNCINFPISSRKTLSAQGRYIKMWVGNKSSGGSRKLEDEMIKYRIDERNRIAKEKIQTSQAFEQWKQMEKDLAVTADEELKNVLKESGVPIKRKKRASHIIYNKSHPEYKRVAEELKNKFLLRIDFSIYPSETYVIKPDIEVQVAFDSIPADMHAQLLSLGTSGRVTSQYEILDALRRRGIHKIITPAYLEEILQFLDDRLFVVSSFKLDENLNYLHLEFEYDASQAKVDKIPWSGKLTGPLTIKSVSARRQTNMFICPNPNCRKYNEPVYAVPTPDGGNLMCPYCYTILDGKRFPRKPFEGIWRKMFGRARSSAYVRAPKSVLDEGPSILDRFGGVKSRAGKKYMDWRKYFFRILVVIFGMILFYTELATFGGGAYWDKYFRFSVFGGAIGVFAIVAKYYSDKKKADEEKEEDEGEVDQSAKKAKAEEEAKQDARANAGKSSGTEGLKEAYENDDLGKKVVDDTSAEERSGSSGTEGLKEAYENDEIGKKVRDNEGE